MKAALIGILSLLPLGLTQAAEIPLYPTGPSEDSAFLRFFNAGATPLELNAEGSDATLRLEGEQRASDFLTVPAGKPIRGNLAQGEQAQALDVSVEPGEFVTVVALDVGQGLRLETIRELPDDFNALKASLALYNLDESCVAAGLKVAGRDVKIFKDAVKGVVQRRMINPLKLSVQLTCAGAATGAPLDLGQLAAGQRYTLLLVPSAQGPSLFMAQDTLAN